MQLNPAPEPLSRREVLRRSAAFAAMPLVSQLGGTNTGSCRIVVSGGKPGPAIDRNIYGLFAEHLGRCIYGGIFDEGSPLSDETGFRKDVIEAFRELRAPMVRWPGGFFASYYHWQDGIGSRDSRPRRWNVPWKQEESNRFGTDEFITWCRKTGAEPQLVLNTFTGTLDEAIAWFEYCNGAGNTHYANLRRKNGHADPFRVRYWELDNEMWVMYPQTAKGGGDYADRVFPFARTLRHLDPNIRLIACGLGKPDWDRAVLERLGGWIDYLALHTYVGSKDAYAEVLGSWREIDRVIRAARQVIDAVTAGQKLKRPIGIAFNEYNIVRDWSSSGQGEGDRRFELRFNLRDALWLATVLNVFQRHAASVRIANYSELVNVVAPVVTSRDGMFRQPPFHTLALYGRHCGDTALDCTVEVETFSTSSYKDVPYVDVSATIDPGTQRIALIATNLHPTSAFDAAIEIRGVTPAAEADVYELNAPHLDTENSFEHPGAVALRQKARIAGGKSFRYPLPAHSITLLDLAAAAR